MSDTWYQLTGTVKNLKDGDQYGNFDLEDATGSVYVYGLLSEKGGEKKKFLELVAAKGIKEGSKITIIGNRGEYNGKIEVMNAYFVSIEGGETRGGGGDQRISKKPLTQHRCKGYHIADFNAADESTEASGISSPARSRNSRMVTTTVTIILKTKQVSCLCLWSTL